MRPWMRRDLDYWRDPKIVAAGLHAGVLFDDAMTANHRGRRDGTLTLEESTPAFLGASLRLHGCSGRHVEKALQACLDCHLLERLPDGRLRIVAWEKWRSPPPSTDRTRAFRERHRERDGNGSRSVPERSGNAVGTQGERDGNGSGTVREQAGNALRVQSTEYSHPSIHSTEAPRARAVTSHGGRMDGWMDGERSAPGAEGLNATLASLTMWDLDDKKRAHVAGELALAGVTEQQIRQLHTLAQKEGDAPHALLARWLEDATTRTAALGRIESERVVTAQAGPTVRPSTEITPEQREAERRRWAAQRSGSPAMGFAAGLAEARRKATQGGDA